jgi:hypothetical protein
MAAVAGGALLAIFARDIGEPPAGDERALSLAEVASAAWPERIAQSAEPQPSAKVSVGYLPTAPLKSQLPNLNRHAERGNAYSACVLASAYDLCERHRNVKVEFEYSDRYLLSMNERHAESFVTAVSDYDEQVSSMCEGIEPQDPSDAMRWRLKAAIAGHPPSMAKLVSWDRPDTTASETMDRDLAVAFEAHAERILNRAAEAGEIQAIEQISTAYTMGEITNSLGSVPIKADDLKALAASQALAMIRDESKTRKIPFDDFDDRELRASIRSAVARMRREQLARFSDHVALYYGAYWKKYERMQDKVGPMSEWPEQACEALRRPADGGARTAAASARGAALRIGADDIGG